MSALTRLVTEEKDNPKLRGSCYVAVGNFRLQHYALLTSRGIYNGHPEKMFTLWNLKIFPVLNNVFYNLYF